MAKGVIYVMTTVVPGLIKIGKTGSSNFESRMYQLERNGYSNVVGLKRYYAIEVEDYDEKELLLGSIFSKSRLENTELFALDVDLVIQLLASFEGRQIYPAKDKEEVFDEAAQRYGNSLIPNGEYILERKVKRWNNQTVKGRIKVNDGRITLLKGSVVCPVKGVGNSIGVAEKMRKEAKIIDNVLAEDLEASSPSAAGSFLLYANCNGWTEWRTSDGKPIDIYRK